MVPFSEVPVHPHLVIGLGNPLLGDDGFGWRVARQVEQQTQDSTCPVEVDYLAVGGLELMERLIGYEHVILIDAISTGQMPVGRIRCLTLGDLPEQAAGHLGSAHDTSLPTAFNLGRALGVPLPDDVSILTVEAVVKYEFDEALTPPVAAALPLAVRLVLNRLTDIDGRRDRNGIS